MVVLFIEFALVYYPIDALLLLTWVLFLDVHVGVRLLVQVLLLGVDVVVGYHLTGYLCQLLLVQSQLPRHLSLGSQVLVDFLLFQSLLVLCLGLFHDELIKFVDEILVTCHFQPSSVVARVVGLALRA